MNTKLTAVLRCQRRLVLLGWAILSTPAWSGEPADFRVAFGSVPGIDLIQQGQYLAAIDILESRRASEDFVALPDEHSTRCALYVLTHDLERGRAACDEAVQKDFSDAAFNNRGVFRVYAGDIDGALDDFRHVGIAERDLDAYIDQLKRSNPRLMAANNAQLIEQAIRKAREEGGAGPERPRSASIENMLQ